MASVGGFRLFTLIAAILIGSALGLGATSTVLTQRAEARFPPEGKFVEVGGARLHVAETGQGRPIVVIHGAFGAAQDVTATLFPVAPPGWHLIAPDRPGHGYSTRPSGPVTPADQARLLHDAVRKMGIERPIVVGFSYGGAVALAWALQYPDEVPGLVLLNGASYPWDSPTALIYDIAGAPVVGPVMNHLVVPAVGALLLDAGGANAFKPEPVPELFTEKAPLPLTIRPASFAANAEDVRELKEFLRAQSRRYGELKMPVTIVIADQDNSVGPDIHGRALHRDVPQSKLVVIPGAGHPVLYAHRDVVMNSIREMVTATR